MLADAHLSTGVLSGICIEFTSEENTSLSSTQIAKVRDAFAEIIRHIQPKACATLIPASIAIGMASTPASCSSSSSDGAVSPTVILAHQHDGADLRARSSSSAQSSIFFMTMPRHAVHMSRSRYSKILKQMINVNVGTESFRWCSELQAMEDKTAGSIATTIISLISEVFRAFIPHCVPLLSASKLAILHLCTGDATNSNEAATRRSESCVGVWTVQC